MLGLVACAVTFSLKAVAQDEKKPPAKEHSMTGCEQKGSTAETFVVANSEAKGPKLIGIVESKDNLAPRRRPYDHHHRRGCSGEGSREHEAQAGQGGLRHEVVRHQDGRGDLQVGSPQPGDGRSERAVRSGSSVVRPCHTGVVVACAAPIAQFDSCPAHHVQTVNSIAPRVIGWSAQHSCSRLHPRR